MQGSFLGSMNNKIREVETRIRGPQNQANPQQKKNVEMQKK